jgi:glucosamine-6-phosphate deaminase
MKIITTNNKKELSKKASEILLKELVKKPDLTIGFATGSTPLELYKELIKSKKDFSQVTTFNLDEYYPIKKNNPLSFYHYMYKNLFNHLKFKEINLLDGETKNPQKECQDYENKIKQIDLQILGIGTNGHIGFNEPGTSFNSKTRLINLTKQTQEDNTKLEGSKVPEKAMTMGLKTIMKAKKIILIASNKNKEKAIQKLINGKITENHPASILKNHKDVTIIITKEIIL